MFASVRAAGLLLCGAVLFTGGAWAQISAIEGDVKGADGSAVKGAEILIERKDMKGTYKGAKSDKKGHYIYNGLPLGTYKVSVIVDGQVRDNVDGVRTKLGDPVAVNFDLKAKVESLDVVQNIIGIRLLLCNTNVHFQRINNRRFGSFNLR